MFKFLIILIEYTYNSIIYKYIIGKIDYYKILEIDKNSTPDEIRKAYKKLAFKYHPDKNPENTEDSEKKFKEISEAYSILSDPSKKSDYDAFGRTEFQSFNYNNFDVFTFFHEFFKNNNDEEFEKEFEKFTNNVNNNNKKPKNDVERRYEEIGRRIRIMNMENGFDKKKYENHYQDDGFSNNFFNNFENNDIPGFAFFNLDD